MKVILSFSFMALCAAFHLVPSKYLRLRSLNALSMHFEEALLGNTMLSQDALKSERYIATNRFNVRKGADAKFEKRWADRKSRIATLPGFRFFALLRKVFESSVDDVDSKSNYISLTVWEDKDSFDAWRTGDAFKEAHGGGGIMDFIALISTALFIVNGSPKPAFYDTLLPLSGDKLDIEAPGGWRNVVADGENLLSPDIHVVQDKYSVLDGQQVNFERVWSAREKDMSGVPGFVYFNLMRRDAKTADDGFNYVSMSVWKNKESYDNWRSSIGLTSPTPFSGISSLIGGKDSDLNALLSSPNPKSVMFEGKLAIMSQMGA